MIKNFSSINYSILCPHVESDHDLKLRRLALYPLSYGDLFIFPSKFFFYAFPKFYRAIRVVFKNILF